MWRWIFRAAFLLIAAFGAIAMALANEYISAPPPNWQIVFSWLSAAQRTAVIMNLDTSDARTLSYHGRTFERHACSVNGRYFAFIQDSSIILLDADGGERRFDLGYLEAAVAHEVAQGAAWVDYLSVADDGDTLLLSLNVRSRYFIDYLIRVSDRAVRRLHGSTSPFVLPVLSPDGAQAAAVDRQQKAVYVLPLEAVGADALDAAQRSALLMRDATFSAWSPAGEALVTAHFERSKYHLDLTDLRSGVSVRVFSMPGYIAEAAWSPDGRYIVYSGNQYSLGMIDLTGGGRARVGSEGRVTMLTNPDYPYGYYPCFLTFRPQALVDADTT